MRRAWWLGVLLVACDFDAAYERRCGGGRCDSSDAGASGGQGGGATAGGSTAGGSVGGGSTAGGQGGGACAPTLELNVMTQAPISATACVHLDIALRCQGVRLDAGVPIQQLRVFNRSTALLRPGTLFSDPTCATSPLTFTTGDVYFNSTVAGPPAYMFGTYEISIEAADAGLSRLVQLEPRIAGSPAMVLLPINTCLTLPPISFVGLNDTTPVLAPARQRFTLPGALAAPLVSCGQQDVLVNTGESTSTGMPQVRSTETAAGAAFSLYGDAGQVTYLVRPCVDGGTAALSGECCGTSLMNVADGGVLCR